jgi:hypothetical protein
MTYRFKPLPELLWGVGIAAGLVVLQALVTLDPEAVKDWRTWAVALGGAAIRAGAGAAIDYIRRSMTQESETEPVEGPFAVIHQQCGGAAFLTLTNPGRGAIMRPADALHLDGTRIAANSKVTCDSCGADLAAPQYRDGYWIAETAGVPIDPAPPATSSPFTDATGAPLVKRG